MCCKRSRILTLAAFALALAFALSAAACGGDSTGPEPAPRTSTIRLLNESATPITTVYFSQCDDTSWGANRLADGETLAPGALRSWTVAPGCYDFRASNGSKAASWFDREITPGGVLQLAVPVEVGALITPADMVMKAATGR